MSDYTPDVQAMVWTNMATLFGVTSDELSLTFVGGSVVVQVVVVVQLLAEAAMLMSTLEGPPSTLSAALGIVVESVGGATVASESLVAPLPIPSVAVGVVTTTGGDGGDPTVVVALACASVFLLGFACAIARGMCSTHALVPDKRVGHRPRARVAPPTRVNESYEAQEMPWDFWEAKAAARLAAGSRGIARIAMAEAASASFLTVDHLPNVSEEEESRRAAVLDNDGEDGAGALATSVQTAAVLPSLDRSPPPLVLKT